MQVKYFIIIIILLIILSVYFGYNYNKNITYKYINKIDTIITIKYDTVYFVKKAKIKYIKDTIIMTKPFVANIDTNINNKIIKIDYSFPENTFKFNMTQQDSIYLYKIKYIEENNDCFLIAFTSGILSGSIIYLLLIGI